MTVYADFNYSGKASDKSNMKVVPTLHLVNSGGHSVNGSNATLRAPIHQSTTHPPSHLRGSMRSSKPGRILVV